MPLKEGKSPEAFSSNVSELMHSGRGQKQALAIAYAQQRKGGNKVGVKSERKKRVGVKK